MELQHLERIGRHVRSLEAALAQERQERDHLENKYARLKRKYLRLEHTHAKFVLETQTTERNAPDASMPRSPEAAAALIDLASPATRRTPSPEPRASWSSTPASSSRSTSRRTSSQSLPSDDICGESPRSPDHADPLERPLRFARTDSMQSATSRSRRQLDFLWTRDAEPQPSSSSLTRQAERTVTGSSELPLRPRPRPRRSAPSPERRTSSPPREPAPVPLRPSAGSDFEQRALSSYAWSTLPAEHSPRPSLPSRGRSISSSSSTARASSSPSPPQSPEHRDDDDAASLALARYLQHQENIAAYEEYENSLRRAREQLPFDEERSSAGFTSAATAYSRAQPDPRTSSTLLAQQQQQQNDIDPDNMTYEELLQLGEQVGDVKKERWRQVAVHVISSLPTHRWRGDNQADVSCIICQSSFEHNDMALTLPCAHVFHEECVGGWIRENNSCPLCKLEIADV